MAEKLNMRDLVFGQIDKVIRHTGSGVKSKVRRLLPSQLKSHRILAGPLRGLSIVASWHDYHTAMIGTTEPPLLAWFARNVHSGETWLDIGANYGYTALALRQHTGQMGRVFAFEPKLSTCGCLAQTMALNGFPEVTVVPMGLGTPDQLELKTLAVNGAMVDSLCEGGSRETILVSRLDWLWPQICGDDGRIDGVKIDVQGMELDVLQGMRSLLMAYAPKLVVELHRGVSRRAILDLLNDCGYEPSGTPIYSKPEEEAEPRYYDNFSYAFSAKECESVLVATTAAGSRSSKQ